MALGYPPNQGMIVREVDSEVLILDTVSNHIHQLNETASIVWRMRREGSAEQAIAAVLAQDFDIAESQALADVRDVLRRLESLKLLCGEPSAAASSHPQAKEC